MSDFTVEPAQLSSAGSGIAAVAATTGAVQIPIPDPQMYGTLVGASAGEAEPFTTTQLNALIVAEAEVMQSISERLSRNAELYAACETENLAQARSFGAQP